MKKYQKLVIASSAQIERELNEELLNDKIKKRIQYIRKNQSFLGLVNSWKMRALEVATKLSDFIPEDDKRMIVKKSLADKIKSFRVENVPLVKRKYSY